MAQTKRKRRTKHRGNAAGSIEARGRTGRPPTPEERKRAGGRGQTQRRELKPPSWRRALIKAGAMAVVFFALTQLGVIGRNATVASGLLLALFAVVLYTPAAYVTDRWAYNRQERRKLGAGRR
jgi:hypothetical protein